MSTQNLAANLTTLRDALRSAELPLPLEGAEHARATRDEAIDQIEDYVLPRLANLDAPLLAVLGGSTGAGKSTLTNSLIGDDVSEAGVLRPTTRSPVLVYHPDDEAWFSGDTILPELPRTSGERGTGYALHMVSSDAVPSGLGILDSPDIDSIEVANHELATQLLGAADLWLFVTTAARYADAVPWQYLARASERAAAVALIVNRIPPSQDQANALAIGNDVKRMLTEHGLGDAELFTIEEATLVDGRMTGGEDEVRQWISALVADAEAKSEVVRRTVNGAVSSLVPRAERVVAAVKVQAETRQALAEISNAQAEHVSKEIKTQLGSGVLLRGEVLERFKEAVGTAEWMDTLQRGVGRLRDRVTSWFTGQPVPVDAAKGQLADNLVSLIDEAITTSVEDAVSAWKGLPGGVAVLEAPLPPSNFDEIQTGVEAWQDDIVALVRREAGGKLNVARGLSLGVNGAGVALMVVLFASTGGLTGGEVAVAGGTAAVSQALLSAVFGEQAVRDLANKARTSLLQRIDEMALARHAVLQERLDGLPEPDEVAALEDALTKVAKR